MTDKKKKSRALIAAVVCYTIFGFSFLATRIGLAAGADPISLLVYRFAVALIVMTAALAASKSLPKLRSHSKHDLLCLLLQGSIQSFIYFLFETYGLRYTSTTFSGVMVSLIPISALVMGALLLRERPNRRQNFCALLSLAGVVCLSLLQKNEGIVTPLGALFMVLAVIVGGFGNTYSRKISGRFTAVERTYACFILGTLGCTVLALIVYCGNYAALAAPLAVPQFWGSILFLGVFSSIAAFFCMNYASTYLPVARVSSFNNLSTVLSLLAGVLLLGEPFTLPMLPAVIVILLGVWGVQHFADNT